MKIIKASTIATLREMDLQRKRKSVNLQRILDSHEALRAENARLREALETYAQFSDSGEMAIVSGRLAAAALSSAAEGD